MTIDISERAFADCIEAMMMGNVTTSETVRKPGPKLQLLAKLSIFTTPALNEFFLTLLLIKHL